MLALIVDHFLALLGNVVDINDLLLGLFKDLIFLFKKLTLNLVIVLSNLLLVMFIYGVCGTIQLTLLI